MITFCLAEPKREISGGQDGTILPAQVANRPYSRYPPSLHALKD